MRWNAENFGFQVGPGRGLHRILRHFLDIQPKARIGPGSSATVSVVVAMASPNFKSRPPALLAYWETGKTKDWKTTARQETPRAPDTGTVAKDSHDQVERERLGHRLFARIEYPDDHAQAHQDKQCRMQQPAFRPRLPRGT